MLRMPNWLHNFMVYRNDLNQVLAMKDSQHKQILATPNRAHQFPGEREEDLESQIQALVKDVAQGQAPPLELEILSQASEGIVRVDKQDAPGGRGREAERTAPSC